MAMAQNLAADNANANTRRSLSLNQSIYSYKSSYSFDRRSGISETTISIESGETDPTPEPTKHICGGKGCCPFCTKYFEGVAAIDATNLTFNPVDPGNWDTWGVYYCSSRFGRHYKFNRNYFALVAIMIVGHSNFFNLIYLMHENGGWAFLIVLFLTYVSYGYLTYLLETLMGQYTGKKPIEMIRHLSPVFSGLGVGLYIRTLYKSINALGIFANCLTHLFDLLFCKSTEGTHIKEIILQERDHQQFFPLIHLTHPYFTFDSEEEFAWDKLTMVLSSLILALTFMKLRKFGAGMTVVLRLLLLFLTAYTWNGYDRIHPSVLDEVHANSNSSVAYLPISLAFKADWLKLIDGIAWMRAMVFVTHTLELGTLVHSYLGSKLFFHYRCTRDGIYLVFVSFTWNVIGAVGILIWLGYVGVNEKEIRNSFHELNGHYGMFVVFIMKHFQAEMTQEVEADMLFFCGIFYFITGTAAILSVVAYLFILTDCAYAESGHPLSKLLIQIWYFFIYAFILFPMLASGDGVRNLIFLQHYGMDAFVGILLIICFTFAVAWSQGMARVLHDFYNIIHLKGYEVITHYHQIPSIVIVLFTGYPFFALILKAIYREKLTEGVTRWRHPVTKTIGYFLMFLPVLAVIFGAIYYLKKERKDKSTPLFEPHRDFYKNKHHTFICFKDYINFDMENVPDDLRSIRRTRKSKLL